MGICFHLSFKIFLLIKKKIFFFVCLGSLLLLMAFSSWSKQRLLSIWGLKASHYGDFSCFRTGLWGSQASVVAACRLSSSETWTLEHRLRKCGGRAQLPHIIWSFSGPWMERTCSLLAGTLLITGPGKCLICVH